jgi:type VI secretion system protein ImpH
MATPGGKEDFDVVRWPIASMLDQEPYRFEFFQAVRLLSRMYPHRKVAGRFNNPSEEVVRFGAYPSTPFPASEIQSLDRRQAPVKMSVNFMGLIGPSGVLPLPYTSLVQQRLREKDAAMGDFFDLFNHRIISLFCLAFEKYRFSIPYERSERDRFSHHVLALIGLGTPGLQDQCSFSESNDYSERLGYGAVVGDEIWDQQSRVRIRLGPLTIKQYVDFLPGGEAYHRIRALTDFYAGGEYDMELQLILKRQEVPPCELTPPGEGPRLGWTSWMKNQAFGRDPGETILEL